MRKLVTSIMAFLLVFSLAYAIAEEEPEQENASSKIEQVLLKKGSLIVKEFISYTKINDSSDYDMEFQTAKITDVETGTVLFGLRLSHHYYNSQYDSGRVYGFLDASEVEGVISTLEYIKEHQNELKDYSEIVYTSSSGVKIGSYYNGNSSLFISARSNATAYVAFSSIDDLINAFKGIQETFDK